MSYYVLRSSTGGGGCHKSDYFITNKQNKLIEFLIRDLQAFDIHFCHQSEIKLKIKNNDHEDLLELDIYKYLLFTYTHNSGYRSEDEDEDVNEESYIYDHFPIIEDYEIIYLDDSKIKILPIDPCIDKTVYKDNKYIIEAIPIQTDMNLIIDVPQLMKDISSYPLSGSVPNICYWNMNKNPYKLICDNDDENEFNLA